jgi:hypothetical protein
MDLNLKHKVSKNMEGTFLSKIFNLAELSSGQRHRLQVLFMENEGVISKITLREDIILNLWFEGVDDRIRFIEGIDWGDLFADLDSLAYHYITGHYGHFRGYY